MLELAQRLRLDLADALAGHEKLVADLFERMVAIHADAESHAQDKGLVIPDEAKANSAAMSAWIDSNRGTKRRKRNRKTAYKPAGSVAPQSTAPTKTARKRKAETAAAPTTLAHQNSITGTPLRIPYGNKDVALKLGARYGSAGWYAPPGADLAAFGEQGWL